MKTISRPTAHFLMCGSLIASICAPALRAQESGEIDPAQRFVETLREQRPGYFDTALEYLERAADDPAVTEEFKSRIGYEQGMTLYRQALTIGDREIRERTLKQAQQKLDTFAKANPNSDWASKSRQLLAGFLLRNGHQLNERIEKLTPTEAAEEKKLRQEARALFSEAQQIFEASEIYFAGRLKKLPAIAPVKEPNPTNTTRTRRIIRRRKEKTAQQEQAKLATERQRLRAEWLFARRQVGEAMYDKAMTWPAASEERKKDLTTAVEYLNRLYEKNDRTVVGLSARLLEGRCYQALGDWKKALSCYEDLIGQKAEIPVIRSLISVAHRHQAECLVKQEKYDEAITNCQQWLRAARGTESNSPEWLAVRYQLALIHRAKALLATKAKDIDGERVHNAAARSEARIVTRKASPWRKPAAELLADLGQGEERPEPTTFDAAYAAGQESIQLMNTESRVLPLARANNPQEVPAIEARIAENRAAAFDYLQLALTLIDDKSDPEKVTAARYYLAYLNYQNSRWYEAAVFGNFAARRFPNSSSARSGAQLALLAFERLYYQAPADDRAFESRHLRSIANHILEQWPQEREAAEAYRVLVDLAIKQDDLATARGFLEKIKPEQRGGVTLQIGLAEWNQYVRASALAETERPSENELLEAKSRAKESLEKGMQLVRESKSNVVTPPVAVGALTLAKMYADQSDYQRAIELLEDPRFGPLGLVESNHSVAQGRYTEETFRTALSAYVSVQPPQREKALAMMDSMEKRLGNGDAKSAARITKIYIRLGLKLKQHLDTLVAAGRGEEASRVKAAFVDFLDRTSQRENGNSWTSRNWIAQMYFQLGKPASVATPLDEQSQDFCEKAEAAFRAILKDASEDSGFAPSANSVLGVKSRLAECLAAQHKFEDALSLYGEVLSVKPNSLPTQQAAATVFQLRGEFENPKWYQAAQEGGLKDEKTGKNLVWGWNQLSRLAIRFAKKDPVYYDAYYDARYNLTLCSFKQAMKLKGEQRSKELARVQSSIEKFELISSGPAWSKHRPEFENLLKQVQDVRQVKQVGFSSR